MRLLRTLTLIYAGVLVSALGASLTAIWIYLRRIASALGEVREALETVNDETQPLDEHFQRLHDAAAGSADELATAQAGLKQANDRLSTLVEQPGEAERSR